MRAPDKRPGLSPATRRPMLLAATIVALASVTAAALAAQGASPSVHASSDEGLPHVTSSGVAVRALWQVGPLIEATVTGNIVAGLKFSHERAELQAVSALSGQSLWTTALPPSQPQPLAILAGGGVVAVEVGHEVGKAPAAVGPVVAGVVVFDARSGRQLWKVRVPGVGRAQYEPIAYSPGLIVVGDFAGGLIAYNAHTGVPVWRAHPAACVHGVRKESGYDDGLAADGTLLVVSYRCPSQREVVVQRLDPRTGAPLWRWSSPVVPAGSSMSMSVLAAARFGDVVLLRGQLVPPPTGRGLVQTFPRPRMWPARLGPFGEDELLLALDARSGKPRWTELGGQQQEVELADGVACETVHVGFECRNDYTGLQVRPVLHTAYSEGSSPPYLGDGCAGISGNLAGVVLSQAPTGVVTVEVLPLTGNGVLARATVALGRTTYGGANYSDFIVAAGPLPGGATLLLLRRVDVAGYPLLALSVGPSPRR